MVDLLVYQLFLGYTFGQLCYWFFLYINRYEWLDPSIKKVSTIWYVYLRYKYLVCTEIQCQETQATVFLCTQAGYTLTNLLRQGG